MATKTVKHPSKYNCPTSTAHSKTINVDIDRRERAAIDASPYMDETVTLACHSVTCNGTIFSVARGVSPVCPKCESRSHAFHVGEFENQAPVYGDDVEFNPDSASDRALVQLLIYGSVADEAKQVKVEKFDCDQGEVAQLISASGVDRARAIICANNKWDRKVCNEIFDPPGVHEFVLSDHYWNYLRSIDLS